MGGELGGLPAGEGGVAAHAAPRSAACACHSPHQEGDGELQGTPGEKKQEKSQHHRSRGKLARPVRARRQQVECRMLLGSGVEWAGWWLQPVETTIEPRLIARES